MVGSGQRVARPLGIRVQFPAVVWLAGLIFVLLPVRGASAQSTPHPVVPSNAVAVVEFTTSGEPSDPPEWAYGLADLLASELQRHKLPLFERTDIRLLLHERLRTVEAGHAFQDIPQIRFLVGGSIRKIGANQFQLSVSATDAHKARERASDAVSGVYPEDVPRALRKIAGTIAAAVNREIPEGPAVQPRSAAAFSRTPEITWLFYRGVAHCLAGEPERGLVYFIEANRADRLFVAAKLWKWRTFELLGLTGLAELARKELEATPIGMETLAIALQGLSGQTTNRPVIALMSGPALPAAGAGALAAFRQAIEASGTYEVFEPARIAALAAEMDLQLTARLGEPAEFTRFQWCAVDGIISFDWLNTSATGGSQFRATYAPALTASPAHVESGPATLEGFRTAASRLLAASKRGAPQPGSTVHGPGAKEGWIQTREGIPRTRDNLARVLRHLRYRPNDHAAWEALVRFRDWFDRDYSAIVEQRLASLAEAIPTQAIPRKVAPAVTNTTSSSAQSVLETMEKRFEALEAVAPQQAPTVWLEIVNELIAFKQAHTALFSSSEKSPEDLRGSRRIRTARGWTGGSYTLPEKLTLEASVALNRILWCTLVQERWVEIRDLGRQLAGHCHPVLAARCLEAVGFHDESRQILEKHWAAIESRLAQHPNGPPSREQVLMLQRLESEKQQAIRQIGTLWRVSGKPRMAAEFLRANLNHFASGQKLTVAREAANAWFAAGEPENACKLFRELSQEPWPGVHPTENPGAVARFHWAECEIRRGALFEAAEILRPLAAECDGKSWSIFGVRSSSPTAAHSSVLKDYVLSALRLTRILAGVQVQSRDWEPAEDRFYMFLPVLEPPAVPRELALELEPALIEQCFARTDIAADLSAAQMLVQRHGRSALPCVLHALNLGLYGVPELLDALAEPRDAPLILEKFKSHPTLAMVAFRLDPDGAAQILRERFGVYANDRIIPIYLWRVIERHRLVDQYPVLMANLHGNAWNVHGELYFLERMIKKDPQPQLVAGFKELLAFRLELHMARGRDYALDEIARRAVRWGVPQGIEALLRVPSDQSADALKYLRAYIDLPESDAEAWETLRAKRGRWQWNEAHQKFE